MTWHAMSHDERIAAVRPLLTLGLSGQKMADAIGGVHRATVNRFARQWLPSVGNGRLARPATIQRPKAKAALPRPAVPLMADDPLTTFLARRWNECAWIEGEPVHDAPCCGRPVKVGESFCPFHRRLVYVRVKAA